MGGGSKEIFQCWILRKDPGMNDRVGSVNVGIGAHFAKSCAHTRLISPHTQLVDPHTDIDLTASQLVYPHTPVTPSPHPNSLPTSRLRHLIAFARINLTYVHQPVRTHARTDGITQVPLARQASSKAVMLSQLWRSNEPSPPMAGSGPPHIPLWHRPYLAPHEGRGVGGRGSSSSTPCGTGPRTPR